MANLCSRHFGDVPVPGCVLCNSLPEDIFPWWEEKVAEAEAAGLHTCEVCSFRYYKTVDSCPKCNHKREER